MIFFRFWGFIKYGIKEMYRNKFKIMSLIYWFIRKIFNCIFNFFIFFLKILLLFGILLFWWMSIIYFIRILKCVYDVLDLVESFKIRIVNFKLNNYK